MPWFIAVPAGLGVLVAAGFLLLAAWMWLHGPAVAQQYRAAFAPEHEITREREKVNA